MAASLYNRSKSGVTEHAVVIRCGCRTPTTRRD